MEILRDPIGRSEMKPGQTLAVGAIRQAIEAYGEETAVAAMRCVTQTRDGNPGSLTAAVIKALSGVLHRHPEWREAGEALLKACELVEWDELQAKAAAKALRCRSSDKTQAEILEEIAEAEISVGFEVVASEVSSDRALVEKAVAQGRVTKCPPGAAAGAVKNQWEDVL